MEPYSFKEKELLDALDKLLKDTKLHQRLKVAAKRMATSESKPKVCQRIEEVIQKFREQQK